MFMVVGFRVQLVAAGCIILWGVAVPLKQCPRLPVHKYSTHFADLRKDDWVSRPHLVLIQRPTGARTQDPKILNEPS